MGRKRASAAGTTTGSAVHSVDALLRVARRPRVLRRAAVGVWTEWAAGLPEQHRAWLRRYGLNDSGGLLRLAGWAAEAKAPTQAVLELVLLVIAGWRLGWCEAGHFFAYPRRGRPPVACPHHSPAVRKKRWRARHS
jgi:hypothetical protein